MIKTKTKAIIILWLPIIALSALTLIVDAVLLTVVSSGVYYKTLALLGLLSVASSVPIIRHYGIRSSYDSELVWQRTHGE